ncbi:hypothetical protein DFQ30_005876 [Apophysomyces sp. BC1015]|nr:hypothetical protein DFQ30_005876 [Apophysomyces sp. BC1015]
MFSLRYRRLCSKTENSPFYYDAKEDEESYDAKMKKPTTLSAQRYRPETIGLIFMTVLSLMIRLWNIEHPNVLIESELEIAKQVNWYLKGKFFIAPHPPLAALLYTAVAYTSGYNGTEQFLYAGQ